MICEFCLKPIAPESDYVTKKPSEVRLKRFAYFHLVPCWEIFEESNRKSARMQNAQKEKKRGRKR